MLFVVFVVFLAFMKLLLATYAYASPGVGGTSAVVISSCSSPGGFFSPTAFALLRFISLQLPLILKQDAVRDDGTAPLFVFELL